MSGSPRCGGCVFRIFGRYGNRVNYYIVAGYVSASCRFFISMPSLSSRRVSSLGPVRAACAVAGNVRSVCQRGHIDTTNADEKTDFASFIQTLMLGSEVRVFGQHMGFWFFQFGIIGLKIGLLQDCSGFFSI